MAYISSVERNPKREEEEEEGRGYPAAQEVPDHAGWGVGLQAVPAGVRHGHPVACVEQGGPDGEHRVCLSVCMCGSILRVFCVKEIPTIYVCVCVRE